MAKVMPVKTKSSTDLSIVIPAYREAHRIGPTLDALSRYLDANKFFKNKLVEIIVVIADADDKTLQIVQSKKKHFNTLIIIQPGKRVGKGRDVRAGMLGANGNKVVYMDADLATPLYHLEQFYNACHNGADIVAGVRKLAKHHKNMVRRSISILGNILFRIAGGVWIADSQCGFKMFNRLATQLCFSKQTILGWGFDMEVLVIAKANGLKIKTIPIDDWVSKPGSSFTDNLFSVIARSLKDLAVILYKRLTKSYVQ